MAHQTNNPRLRDAAVSRGWRPYFHDGTELAGWSLGHITGASRIRPARMLGHFPGYGKEPLDIFCKVAPIIGSISFVSTFVFLIYLFVNGKL